MTIPEQVRYGRFIASDRRVTLIYRVIYGTSDLDMRTQYAAWKHYMTEVA